MPGSRWAREKSKPPAISQARVGISWIIFDAGLNRASFSAGLSPVLLSSFWWEQGCSTLPKRKASRKESDPVVLCKMCKTIPPQWRCLHSLSVLTSPPVTMNFSVWAAVRMCFTCTDCCGLPQSSTSLACFWGLSLQPFLGHLRTW